MPSPPAVSASTNSRSSSSRHRSAPVAVAAVAVVAAISLTGCFNHLTPGDKSVEHTTPLAIAATSPPMEIVIAPPPPLVASCSPPSTSPPPLPVAELPAALHVVTFNLHIEPGAKIIRGLRDAPALRDADLFILEEVHRIDGACSTACVIARELGFYAAYAPSHVNGDGTDGVAVVSRAPILSARVIELPHFFVVMNGGRRIAMAVTIRLAGRPVTVYAVHLENRLTVAQRRRQLVPVLEDAKRTSGPAIIAGDFNTSPFTWLGHVFPVPIGTQDDHLEALVRDYGFQTPVILSGPTHHHLWMKLDAIYTRDLTTWEFATATATAHDVSDHLALWAKMYPTDRPGTRAANVQPKT